jgi:hypothetical protein
VLIGPLLATGQRRNPKSHARNPKQIQKGKNRKKSTNKGRSTFIPFPLCMLSQLFRISDFGFRISDLLLHPVHPWVRQLQPLAYFMIKKIALLPIAIQHQLNQHLERQEEGKNGPNGLTSRPNSTQTVTPTKSGAMSAACSTANCLGSAPTISPREPPTPEF